MFFKLSFKIICISLLVNQCVQPILIGTQELNASKSSTEATSTTISDTNVKDSDQANTTFYYEAEAFLPSSLKKKVEPKNETNPRPVDLPPASVAMTSSRNGRMMDLDALLGDYAASQANRERNLSGNRQSRFLPGDGGSNVDLGKGKKLHIQGFIPIMGIKDVADQSGFESAESTEASDLSYQMEKAAKQLRQQTAELKSNQHDLPYAQSSMGHATFGVQRYLNVDQQQQQQQQQQQHMPAYHQQAEQGKISGAGMMENLKKPIKKLVGLTGKSNNNENSNCLCVPFYMCKNGFISESSLGKTQIQQMIMQQQVLQNSQPELKSTQMMVSAPARQLNNFNPDLYPDVAVDERSLDRELITAPPSSLILSNSSEASSFDSQLDLEQQQQSMSALTHQNQTNLSFIETVANNSSTDSQTNSDYSQEILGRMLGLKSEKNSQQHHQLQPTSYMSSPAPSGNSQSGGVCGLLRTCCNIPHHLYLTQSDDTTLLQFGGDNYKANMLSKPHSDTAKMITAYPLQAMAFQQQAGSFAGALNQQQQQKLPYGFPSSQITQRMQAASNSYNLPPKANPVADMAMMMAPLAHRTTQLQAMARFQPTSVIAQPSQTIAQYTRAATPNNQLMRTLSSSSSSFQLAKSAPSNTIQQMRPPAQPAAELLGRRKILEGRCGLRQAAGITGRVQNLQYHESSADFGEYPAQAAILKRISGSDSLFVCGGALISQYWVATAAHCIKKHSMGELKIRLGEWDVHRDDEFYPFVEKEIRDVIVHPEFVAGNLMNDIALLRMDSPVDPTLPHVGPACLPSVDESFVRQNCWVTGWGKDSFGQKGSFQAVLREVELPVVGHSECETALRQTRLGPHYRLHSGFICAGGEGGKDACEGDGGSGLFCAQDGVVKVAGLVSWGIGCGQAGVPGVYVNMAYYRPWIENIISIDEDIYSSYTNMISNSLISERSNSNSSLSSIDSSNTSNSNSTATS